MRTIDVFGFQMAAADYRSAFDEIVSLSKQPKPASVALCATHAITTARMDSSLGQIFRGFDMLLPDGMPVVWLMNAMGAGLRDRVYGPYFMRYVIEHAPRPYRHFLFGGSEECLAELKTSLRRIQPEIDIAGVLSPPYRQWSEDDEREFARVINGADPDFIWVALGGGGKQEAWIAQNAHRYARGVFIAVGDAFELLAGRRSFAPAWMQRIGLTWLYRLIQEPGRLWKRYLIYNTAFIWFALMQLLRRQKN